MSSFSPQLSYNAAPASARQASYRSRSKGMHIGRDLKALVTALQSKTGRRWGEDAYLELTASQENAQLQASLLVHTPEQQYVLTWDQNGLIKGFQQGEQFVIDAGNFAFMPVDQRQGLIGAVAHATAEVLNKAVNASDSERAAGKRWSNSFTAAFPPLPTPPSLVVVSPALDTFARNLLQRAKATVVRVNGGQGIMEVAYDNQTHRLNCSVRPSASAASSPSAAQETVAIAWETPSRRVHAVTHGPRQFNGADQTLDKIMPKVERDLALRLKTFVGRDSPHYDTVMQLTKSLAKSATTALPPATPNSARPAPPAPLSPSANQPSHLKLVHG